MNLLFVRKTFSKDDWYKIRDNKIRSTEVKMYAILVLSLRRIVLEINDSNIIFSLVQFITLFSNHFLFF
jgi:hypothetical protein